MAQVVSATFILDVPQIDGRVRVYQSFVMDDGSTRSRDYLADEGEDHDAALAVATATLNSEGG